MTNPVPATPNPSNESNVRQTESAAANKPNAPGDSPELASTEISRTMPKGSVPLNRSSQSDSKSQGPEANPQLPGQVLDVRLQNLEGSTESEDSEPEDEGTGRSIMDIGGGSNFISYRLLLDLDRNSGSRNPAQEPD